MGLGRLMVVSGGLVGGVSGFGGFVPVCICRVPALVWLVMVFPVRFLRLVVRVVISRL